MRFDTLLTRTILLITGVVVAISLSFVLLQRLTIGLPMVDASAEYLAARMLAASTAEVTTSADPPDTKTWAPLRSLYRRELEAALRQRLGPELEYRESAGGEISWLRSPGTAGRWVGIPNRLRSDAVRELFTWMLLSAAALIAVAAFGFARRVTRPLTELARGALRLPQVPLDPALSRQGPVEIRNLAAVLAAQSQALETRDRERAVMLAAISHDLRTPLARMRLALEMSELPEGAGRREIEHNVDEIDAIVEQFISFARGTGDETAVPLSLDELVRGMPIEHRLGAPATLALRPLSMRRALTNLIENARRYGAPPIVIITEQDAERVRVLVQDAGAGLSAEQVARAVQPFVRLEPTAGQPGTGLGLAIAERVARAHGGGIIFRRGPAAFAIGLELPRAPLSPRPETLD